MATHELLLEDGVLEFQDEGEWARFDLPQPDPEWRGVDSNGHEHYAVKSGRRRTTYPTLEEAVGEPYWCDDCRDEHQDTWYECRICHEKVVPGTFVDPTPQWMSTGGVYYWNGERISTERANEIIAKQQRAELAARRLTSRPPIGSRVGLAADFGATAVTVVPTAEGEPEDRVTVMHDGSGRMETLPLDQLLRVS